MTSLDPDIDGGLPWFRGVVRPLEPGLEPGRKQPRNHLVPGVVPTLQPTSGPHRQCAALPEHACDFTEEKPGRLPTMLCRELSAVCRSQSPVAYTFHQKRGTQAS